MQKIVYETPSGEDTRTRQFLLWLTVCERAVPEDALERGADSDRLVWLTPHVPLEDDQKQILNSYLPKWHRWHF